MARKKLELRRTDILEAAAEQIRTAGIAATRVSDVARALGVSTGLIFYHFETKEKLLAETFAYACQRDFEALDAACGADGRVITRLRDVLRLYSPAGDESWLLWIDGWAASVRDPELLSVVLRLGQRWRQAIAGLLEEGRASGEFQLRDPQASASRVCAFLDGLAVARVVRGDQVASARLGEWTAEFVSAELGVPLAELY